MGAKILTGAWWLANALTLALLAGCPVPSSPAADAGVAVAACKNLSALGCAEGAKAACASRLELGMTTEHRLTPAQASCAAAATSKTSARTCVPGYIACP